MHAASRTYDLAGLAADPQALSAVVAYDRPWLGDLPGLDVVHLQCHIGTDTVSLARLGARVTGVDFSPGALAVARDLGRRRAGSTPDSSSRSSTRCPTCSAPTSTSCTRAWARSTGCPTSPAGRGSWPGCCGPGGRLYVRDGAPDAARRMDYGGVDDDAAARSPCPTSRAEAQHWVSERHLHRRSADRLARAVRVEPRARRDRAGSDRRGTHSDRAAGAPGVRVAGARRTWSRVPTASSASPRAPSGSRSCSRSRRSRTVAG